MPLTGVDYPLRTAKRVLAAIKSNQLAALVAEDPEDVRIEYAPIFLPKLFYLRNRYAGLKRERPWGPMWRNLKTWDALLDTGLLRNLTYVDLDCTRLSLEGFLQLVRLPSLRFMYLIHVDWNTDDLLVPMSDLTECPKLKILQFSDSRIEDSCWKLILERIQCLEMFSYDRVGWNGLDEWEEYDPSPVIDTLLDLHGNSLSSLRLYCPENSGVSSNTFRALVYLLP